MSNLRRKFERFCFQNRNKGIPNLMLYISVGTAVFYMMTVLSRDPFLYNLLYFDRNLILQGQVWRLISFPLTYGSSSLFSNDILGARSTILIFISLLCYFSLGRAMENVWGTLKFNLYYLCGIVMMDIYCMIFGGYADVYYLNLSLFLAYATLYPNTHFLLFFVIPVKAWIFALFDLALVLFGLFAYPFPSNLFSVISLANYFLFFGKDVMNVIPLSWQANFRRLFRKKKNYAPKQAKTIPFPNAGSYEATVASVNAPYTHRCTVCGKTDVTHPDLEFRYCSRCNGYHCYCEEHISNHTHVQ